MNDATSQIAVTFNAKYADITAGAKLVRDELEKNIQFLKKLGREAKNLYKYGNMKCYVEDDNHCFHPIDGIENLGIKMEYLNMLTSAHDAIRDVVDDLDRGGGR